MSWFVSEIKIQGVKGVLDESGDFITSNKGKPKSIIVFAPNGCGKSGFADAIEYFFSEDGMVEHLGKGGADSERGGKHALPHILADEKGISPQVSLSLGNTETGKILHATRQVRTGRSDNRPIEINNIIRQAPAHRVLRQHDLRRFVVEMSPSDKYSELSRWIGLTKLEQILKHLVTTSNSLQNTNLDREIIEREKDIQSNTNNVILSCDTGMIIRWCLTQASPYLVGKHNIQSIDDLSIVVNQMRNARDNLILSSGTSEIYEAKKDLDKNLPAILKNEGPILNCKKALQEAYTTEKKLQSELEKAKDSVFKELWSVAKTLLVDTSTSTCPVCNTEWAKTKAGTQEMAVEWLQGSLNSLSKLQNAEDIHHEKSGIFKVSLEVLVNDLSSIMVNLKKIRYTNHIKEIEEVVSELKIFKSSTKPFDEISNDITKVINRITSFVSGILIPDLGKLELKDVPEAVNQIDLIINKIETLQKTVNRLEELEIEKLNYRKVEQSFNDVADLIRERSAQLINKIVDAFREDVLSIYRTIHPTSTVPNIYIVPNTDDRTLGLRIDFQQPGRKVPPAGYLSESYLNTLGLALFLSSVRLFNKEFPFIFLDDIVSSYDADHRSRIVNVIAEQLEDFQVFLTTHDNLFYSMLRDRLSEKGWYFEKITSWSFEHGPRRETDCLQIDEINGVIKIGNPAMAGNMVRQYMENWLDKMCEKYEAYTIHKRGDREFNRTLFDLWDPFINRLTTIRGDYFKKYVASKICYERLKAHSILNYYSHSQSNPYEWSSMGDVTTVWEEFQNFTKLFQCASCGKLLKFEENENRLYCTCGNQIFN